MATAVPLRCWMARPDAEGPAILASKVHQIGRTLGAVKLQLAAEDSYLHLDRDLPDQAGAGLRRW